MSAQTTLTYQIQAFLEHMEVEKGSSPLTIRNYKHYLTRFSEYLESEEKVTDIGEINQEVVRKYRLYLTHIPSSPSPNETDTLARKTQGYHVIALRSFLRWLVKNDYKVMSPDKIDLPKIKDREITFLSGEHVDKPLNAPTASRISGKRDKAILELLYSTGLRVSELVSLNKDKIDYESREFGVVGKGGKARVVFLSQRAAAFLKDYIEARNDHFTPLFIRHKGKVDPATTSEEMRLTPRSIQRMIKKYGKKMKLPVNVTPHVLRHSFATDLLMAGADLRSVQEMLGHKNVSTTQIYTHVTNKQLKEVHEAFHGRDK